MENRILNVYDTITRKLVDVEVPQDIYDEYKMLNWRIKKKNRSFYDHEVQFSMLISNSNSSLDAAEIAPTKNVSYINNQGFSVSKTISINKKTMAILKPENKSKSEVLYMFLFIIAFLAGSLTGMLTMCLCIVAGKADRYEEDQSNE